MEELERFSMSNMNNDQTAPELQADSLQSSVCESDLEYT
jgi:hypothetical protein